MNNFTKEKMESIIGQELKYKKLCEALDIPVKNGQGKRTQLKDLGMYCELEKLEKPTRFRINEVYEEAFTVLDTIRSNNKIQLKFDAALFQALIKQNGYPLYISKFELIEMFQEVNKNFAVTFNYYDMKKLGRNFEYMSQMGEVVYGILKQWTERKIESMQKRGVIILGEGYRVYTEHKNSRGQRYIKKHDVPVSTIERINDLHELCNKVYYRAKNTVIPPYEKNKDGKVQICNYYPKERLSEFERVLDRNIFEATDGKYCKLKKVFVILPPDKEWMVEKLKEIYGQEPDLKDINEEACNKVLKTTQLDAFTNDERKQFILYNMTNNPPMSFKDELERIAEREKMKVEMEEEE